MTWSMAARRSFSGWIRRRRRGVSAYRSAAQDAQGGAAIVDAGARP